MSVCRLDGRRIVVTGGASGMGEAMVRAFPGLGADVASLDVSQDAGASIAKEAGARFVTADVSDPESVDAAFTQAVGATPLRHAPVDPDDRAGRVTRGVGGQEQCRADYLGRPPDPLQCGRLLPILGYRGGVPDVRRGVPDVFCGAGRDWGRPSSITSSKPSCRHFSS